MEGTTSATLAYLTADALITGSERRGFFLGNVSNSAVLNCTSIKNGEDGIRVNGGGTTGQAGAIVLGIARALEAINPNLHAALAEGGYLTRDSRMVERKKYGHKKSRRSFQFSKR